MLKHHITDYTIFFRDEGFTMNKMMGFYELKESGLPAIRWKEFEKTTSLDQRNLWTIRSALQRGNDINLPRLVGERAEKAEKFALELYDRIKNNGMVIYYPYFLAEKSGTLNIYKDRIVIEAVKDDLWNLVSYSDCEVTIQIQDQQVEFYGNRQFISPNELEELLEYAKRIKGMFREELYGGKSILLEWSYAYDSDIEKKRIGNNYLIFYEIRTV